MKRGASAESRKTPAAKTKAVAARLRAKVSVHHPIDAEVPREHDSGADTGGWRPPSGDGRGSRLQWGMLAGDRGHGSQPTGPASALGGRDVGEEEDDKDEAEDPDIDDVADSRRLAPLHHDTSEGMSNMLLPPLSARLPLPWAVTGAFHMALWYILHYAGPAVPPVELWVWRSLLQLSQRGGGEGTGESVLEDGHGAAESALAHSDDQLEPDMEWVCSDEVELLLRLALRKPPCFTVKSLETALGDALHVHTALAALEETELIHWMAAADGPLPPSSPSAAAAVTATAPLQAMGVVPQPPRMAQMGELSRRVSAMMEVVEDDSEGGADAMARSLSCSHSLPKWAAASCSPHASRTRFPQEAPRKRARQATLASPLVRRCSGPRIAALITALSPTPAAAASSPATHHGSADGTSSRVLPPSRRAAMEEELLQVLHAARGAELRTCATALHRCCHAHHLQQQRRGAEEEAEAETACWADSGRREDSTDSLVVLSAPPGTGHGLASTSAEEQAAPPRAASPSLAAATASRATEEEEGDDGKRKGPAMVPTRKRDIMAYLVERRYLQVAAPVGTPTSRLTPKASAKAAAVADAVVVDMSEAQERELIAQCWDSFIGDCVTVEPAVKSAVSTVAELFQLITGNLGAGGVLATMEQQPIVTQYVATAPTTLLTGQQLRLLTSFVHVAMATQRSQSVSPPPPVDDGGVAESRAEGGRRGLRAPVWWWDCGGRGGQAQHVGAGPSLPLQDIPFSSSVSTAPKAMMASFAGAHRVRLLLFRDGDTLAEYRRALAVHRALFEVTLGASTLAQKLKAKDADFITSVYKAVTRGLSTQQRESARRAKAQMQAARMPPPIDCGKGPSQSQSPDGDSRSDGVWNIESALLAHGLRAQHLLQFTPLYRWYACLELLYPLLQSAHMYKEANECLVTLLEVPVYKIYPPTSREDEESKEGLAAAAPPSSLPCVFFPIFYRPQKRGDWLHRVAQNMMHLHQKEKALQLLERAHDAWCAARERLAQDVMLKRTFATLLDESASFCFTPAQPPRCRCGAQGERGGEDEEGGEAQQLREHCPAGEGDITQETAAVASAPQKTRGRTAGTSAVLLENLPPVLQRRCRLLRAIWPEDGDTSGRRTASSADDTGANGSENTGQRLSCAAGPLVSRSLYHACMEYRMGTYLRRPDALAMERTLCSLHKALRKWTPLPARHARLTNEIWDVKEVLIRGMRDPMDPQMWRDPELRKNAAMFVEPFVMEYLLRIANRQVADSDASNHGNTGKIVDAAGLRHHQHHRHPEESLSESVEDEADGAGWRGLHCEGAWVAYAARVLLWDCYHHPVTTEATCGPRRGAANGKPGHETEHEAEGPGRAAPEDASLWLTSFQEGPLDLLVSHEFTTRRRRLLEDRLRYFERSPKSALLRYAADHMRGAGDAAVPPSARQADGATAPVLCVAPPASAAAPPGGTWRKATGDEACVANAGERDGDGKGEGSNAALLCAESDASPSPLSCSDLPSPQRCLETQPQRQPAPLLIAVDASAEASVMFAQEPTAATGGAGEEGSTMSAGSDTIPQDRGSVCEACATATEEAVPPELRVYVGAFPLLAILRAVPKRPLLRLLRCLYLSDLEEGHSLKFSGFPDLLLWRSPPPLPTSADLGEDDAGEAEGDPVAYRVSDTFRLVEVKSPHDVLSTKQIVVNDCLRRCGFDIRVAHVVEVEAAAAATAAAVAAKQRQSKGKWARPGVAHTARKTATSK